MDGTCWALRQVSRHSTAEASSIKPATERCPGTTTLPHSGVAAKRCCAGTRPLRAQQRTDERQLRDACAQHQRVAGDRADQRHGHRLRTVARHFCYPGDRLLWWGGRGGSVFCVVCASLNKGPRGKLESQDKQQQQKAQPKALGADARPERSAKPHAQQCRDDAERRQTQLVQA